MAINKYECSHRHKTDIHNFSNSIPPFIRLTAPPACVCQSAHPVQPLNILIFWLCASVFVFGSFAGTLLTISMCWLYKFYIQIYCPPFLSSKRKAPESPPPDPNPSFFSPIVLIMHGFGWWKGPTTTMASVEKPFSPLVPDQLDFVHHRLISNEIIGKGQQKNIEGDGLFTY